MSFANNIQWKRLSVNAAAIVASILLAFAIDAWWQERLEREDESEQLVGLHDEFVVNFERLDRYLIAISGGQHAAQEVFRFTQAAQNNAQTSVDLPSLLLLRMTDAPTFEAHTPVLDGLISSGRHVLFEDGHVIASLATWESSLRNYSELAIRTRQNIDLHLIPALANRGDFGTVLMNSPRWASQLYEIELDQMDVTRIKIDDEFKTFVAQRHENGARVLGNLNQLKEAADAVIKAIEAAQAD